ncbi:MAG: SDR family NAD(P)-dependent oxidoreductase [Bacteroidaceae bacterium]
MKKILIIGATSGIGKEIALRYAETDAVIGLVGRREDKLEELYKRKPTKFKYRTCDISNNRQTVIPCLEGLINEMGGMDVLLLSAGTGELNPSLEYELEEPTLLTNVFGFTSLIDWAFLYFEHQKYGHLVVITSVGGFRGSSIAPAYNASKAYQMNYLEGLRQKASKLNNPLYITDLRPGFVDTAMAKGDGLFWVSSLQKASSQIYSAIEKKKRVAYIGKRWRYIAFLLKIVPSAIYCKM